MAKQQKVEYDVFHVQRRCDHWYEKPPMGKRCKNIVTHFAAPKGSNPETVPVWCTEHADDARP